MAVQVYSVFVAAVFLAEALRLIGNGDSNARGCDGDWEDDEGGMLFRAVPEIRKIYFNDRHTTIEWMDGEKTTVGCVEGQPFDEYSGFGAAVLKRLFGSSTAAIRCMNECKEVQPAPGKKVKPPTGKTGVKHRA